MIVTQIQMEQNVGPLASFTIKTNGIHNGIIYHVHNPCLLLSYINITMQKLNIKSRT